MKLSRLSCLIPIHQNMEALASLLMSLIAGYANPYLPIHILKRKESVWTYISLKRDLMLSILTIYFIINRCRQMFQLILKNRLQLLFLTHSLQPLHPKLRNSLRKVPKYREPQHINWNQNSKLLIDSVEDYARKRIFNLSRSMSYKVRSIFNDKCVVDNLTDLHNIYVVVPADKTSNNIVIVCKTYYTDCLVNELGINNNTCNPTYTPTSLSEEEILSNHNSIIWVIY